MVSLVRRLFGGADLSPDRRRDVIRYVQAEWTLRAVQDDEAGRYNEVLTVHGTMLAPGNESARIVADAAKKMSEVNQSLVQRHSELGPVPDEAGQCYFLWHGVYLALAEWSSAAAAAYEAMTTGGTPSVGRVEHLLSNEERARKQAESAEAKLLKSIRMTAEEARTLMRQAEGRGRP